MFEIRAFHPSDLTQLYRICLQTGDSGQDATPFYQDPELIGHYYAAPYAVLEPDLCFILTHQGKPCGYVLGTPDSRAFAARSEVEWFPPLRQRYPLPHPEDSTKDALIARRIHQGHDKSDYPGYPAELHIDLLPIAQGKGLGKQMMDIFLNTLSELDVTGLHLGVGRRNTGAFGFYRKLGFEVLQEHELWWSLGKKL